MLTFYPKMGQHTVLKKEGFVSLRQGDIFFEVFLFGQIKNKVVHIGSFKIKTKF